MNARRAGWLVGLALLLSLSSGCLFRSRVVETKLSTAPLKDATAEELVASYNAIATSVQTLNATVDIDATVGGAKKGSITDFTEIRGYILAQKPFSLRMIGLVPVVHTRAFDMVSGSEGFRIWIPAKNQFITGPSELKVLSKSAIENLRPSVIYQAILPQPIDPTREIAVFENGVERLPDEHGRHTLEQSDYRLSVITRNGEGPWSITRRIYFSRVDLRPYRQVIFNAKGEVATDATYSDYQEFNGVYYPSYQQIKRPQEEYTIGLHIVALKLNEPLTPEQFKLDQPEGVVVKRIGESVEPKEPEKK